MKKNPFIWCGNGGWRVGNMHDYVCYAVKHEIISRRHFATSEFDQLTIKPNNMWLAIMNENVKWNVIQAIVIQAI